MYNRNVTNNRFSIYVAIIISALFYGAVFAQERGARFASSKPSEEVIRDARIPLLYKRLNAAIGVQKFKADTDGAYLFNIKSGYHYDIIERVFMMYSKKARIYMAQDRVSKIVIEYYQFNMSSQVREVKIFTNTAPESDDLKSLLIEYSTNTGELQKYTVSELKKDDSKKDIMTQYHAYLLALVFKVEMMRDKTGRKESEKIDRIIQLGE